MQKYKVLVATNGTEREVPQRAIATLPTNTNFRVVLTRAGKKRNKERRAEQSKGEQEKEETSF